MLHKFRAAPNHTSLSYKLCDPGLNPLAHCACNCLFARRTQDRVNQLPILFSYKPLSTVWIAIKLSVDTTHALIKFNWMADKLLQIAPL